MDDFCDMWERPEPWQQECVLQTLATHFDYRDMSTHTSPRWSKQSLEYVLLCEQNRMGVFFNNKSLKQVKAAVSKAWASNMQHKEKHAVPFLMRASPKTHRFCAGVACCAQLCPAKQMCQRRCRFCLREGYKKGRKNGPLNTSSLRLRKPKCKKVLMCFLTLEIITFPTTAFKIYRTYREWQYIYGISIGTQCVRIFQKIVIWKKNDFYTFLFLSKGNITYNICSCKPYLCKPHNSKTNL